MFVFVVGGLLMSRSRAAGGLLIGACLYGLQLLIRIAAQWASYSTVVEGSTLNLAGTLYGINTILIFVNHAMLIATIRVDRRRSVSAFD